jgi:hypothetical protein
LDPEAKKAERNRQENQQANRDYHDEDRPSFA